MFDFDNPVFLASPPHVTRRRLQIFCSDVDPEFTWRTFGLTDGGIWGCARFARGR